MKTLIAFFIGLLQFLLVYGWKGIVAIFIPVSWQQDLEFKNKGFDIIYFSNCRNSYFYGTIRQRNNYLEML